MALIYFEVLLTFVPLTPHCPWSTRERLLEQVKVDSLKSRWDGSHRLWAKIQDMPTTFNTHSNRRFNVLGVSIQ